MANKGRLQVRFLPLSGFRSKKNCPIFFLGGVRFGVLRGMSHTATVSHKQELTNQRSPHFHDKVAQNKELLYSEEELRDTPCHTCDFVAR